MARTGGPRRCSRARWLAAAAVLLPPAALAACGSDAAKEATLEKLAVGTWACTPDEAGDPGSPFHIDIREGGFTVTLDDTTEANRKLTGVWSVEAGDLAIEFTGQGAGAPAMGLDDFDELTPESTSFRLTEPGIYAPSQVTEDMTDEEWEAALAEPPVLDVDMAIDIRGSASVALDTAEGNPWTCRKP